jgi:hypothetical protein
MLFLLNLGFAIATATITAHSQLKEQKHKQGTGLDYILFYLVHYWEYAAGIASILLIVAVLAYLILRSKELESEFLPEQVFYINGRKIKTPMTNIFKYDTTQRTQLDSVGLLGSSTEKYSKPGYGTPDKHASI